MIRQPVYVDTTRHPCFFAMRPIKTTIHFGLDDTTSLWRFVSPSDKSLDKLCRRRFKMSGRLSERFELRMGRGHMRTGGSIVVALAPSIASFACNASILTSSRCFFT